MKLRPSLRGVAGAAVLIGIITILARIAGFGRTVVLAQSVGPSCLLDTYYAANMVPNIVFEIVAGGALAGMVVPVLTGSIGRDDGAAVRRTTSALLTWVTVLLLPLSVLVALVASPLMGLLVRSGRRGCERADMVRVAAEMLVMFAPQIVLYGLAVVLYGVLQAHRRFTGPALAPLVSSLVVIGAYVAYVPLHANPRDLTGLPPAVVPVLGIGTTLGVVALVVTAVVAARPIGLRVRPTLRFPPGVAARVRRLAFAGLATVAAQQIATVGVLMLSFSGNGGTLSHYMFAWAVFLLPWAVLAVPVATSAFPALSAQAEAERGPDANAAKGTTAGAGGFDRTAATTTRAVVLVSCAGAALLAAVAVPAAYFLDYEKPVDPDELARAIVAFAPGLLGYGLVAHLGRALYACHRGRASATAVVAGWLGVLAADVVLVALLHRDFEDWVVAALGLGNTIGMTLAGALLLVALVRARSSAALAGVGRAGLAGVVGGVAAGVAGYGVAVAIGTGGQFRNIGAGVAAAGGAAVVFLAVAYLIDRRDVQVVLRRAPPSPP